MSTLREAAIGAMGALETARNGLAWYRDRYPESTDGSDDEAAGDIDAAIDALRAELAKPDARPAPAEPQVAERGLRELLAGRIAGAMLYHDDGELQDNSAHPCIDFLRDSAETIKQKLMERAIAGLENLTNPPTPTPQPAGGEPQPAAQQEPLTVDYSGCDICARETATIAGFRLMVDPSLPPDVLVFRQGEREVGRIINAGITATKGER